MKKRIWISIALVILFYLAWQSSEEKSHSFRRSPAKRIKNISDIVASTQKQTVTQMSATAETDNDAVFKTADLSEILRTNDYCALIRRIQSQNLKPLDYETLRIHLLGNADLLLHSSDDHATFDNLFNNQTGPDTGDLGKSISSGTKILKFYNALLFADLFRGVESIELNLQHAEVLLTELISEDPDNGAFPYFLSYVKEKLGRDPSEVDKLIVLMMKSPKFDTYVTNISRRVFERGLQDPTSWAAAIAMISILPIPDYNAPYFMLRKRLKIQKQWLPLVLDFGKLLMRQGLQLGSTHDEFIYWIALEHTIGNNLYKYAWEELYPNQNMDSKYSVTIQDLFQAKEVNDRKLYGEIKFSDEMLLSKDSCPNDKILDSFSIRRKDFLEFDHENTN